MDDNLVPFKDDFYKECNTINFFLKLLEEIQTQIEFYGHICEKDYKIIMERAENGLKYLKILKNNLKIYKDEPSNLFLIENQLIKFSNLYFSSFKNIFPDFESSIKKNISKINQNIKNTKMNILNHSVSMLKQTRQTKKRNELFKYIKETLELMMINIFKSLFNFYQIILIFSKKKNDLFQSIKIKTEEFVISEEINVIINEISERSYAEKYKIKYISLHFGNNIYKELLNDDNYDVMELSKSYLNYTLVFIKCIKMRKKLIKELRIFFDVIQKKEKEQIDKFKKICGKITLQTKSLSYSSQGIINSWNLVFSSWNSIYTNLVNNLQFLEEIWNPKLNKIINECNEEYKAFEKRWENYSSKINELCNNYLKFPKIDEKSEIISEKKKSEEELKNYLTIDCANFLDNNISLLRENEIKRANGVKDLIDKIISHTRNRFEQYLENSEKEYDNAASIDLFEEVQNIFESQFESCGIIEQENFLENLKEKIEKIDFNDILADNARLSLAEYYVHDDFDEELDFTKEVLENPFGPVVKNNEEGIYNFNEEKNLSNLDFGIRGMEEDISSIPINGKNMDMINLNMDNHKTPSFNFKNQEKENKVFLKNLEENDLVSDLNIINNLNDKFNELGEINNNISKFEDNIDKNKEIKDKTKNNFSNNKNEISKKESNNKNQNEEQINHNKDLNMEKVESNKEIRTNNIKEVIKIKDKQTVYYGILGILGLFCLKSLLTSNYIFSYDSFLNLVILGIIGFVIYKSQIN